MGAHLLLGPLSRRGLNPIKLASIHDKLARLLAPLTVGTFNQLSQYVNRPGHMAHCYAELPVSAPMVAVTIARTHFT